MHACPMQVTDKAHMKQVDINPRAVGLALVKLFSSLTFEHVGGKGEALTGRLKRSIKFQISRVVCACIQVLVGKQYIDDS